MTSPLAAPLTAARCAQHPGRPAVDRCPVCDRPRCGADSLLEGCAVCGGVPDDVRVERARPGAPTVLERLVSAALASTAVAFLWGLVSAEYVDAPLFGYLVPAALGVLVGGAATTASRVKVGQPYRLQVRLIAVLYALFGTGFAFLQENSLDSRDPLTTNHVVLLSYAITAAACFLGTSTLGTGTKKPQRSTRA